MQHTIRCDYRNTVTKTNTDGKEVKYGMFPTVVQSKFRIDQKRPMGKDGKEKQPWSKSFIKNLFYDCSKSKLYTILDVPKCSQSKMVSVELNDKEKIDLKTELDYINEDITKNFKKITDLFQQVEEILSENDLLLRERTYLGVNVSMSSNFLKIQQLMLQVKGLIHQNDKIFWEYTHFESGFI